MKYLLLLLLAAVDISTAQIHWEKLTPPEIIKIEAIEINKDGHIFLGTLLNGVYQSKDNGSTWFRNNDSDFPWAIVELAITEGGNILCGTQLNPTYLSTDNGKTWDILPVGTEVYSIKNNSKGWLYMANGDNYRSIFRSTNDGVDWEVLKDRYNFDGYIRNIEITLSDDIYLSSIGRDDAYVSNDNGETFTPLNINRNTYDIILNSNKDIFLGGYNGFVYYSFNHGNNWDSVKIADNTIYCLEIDNNDKIYAGTLGDGIYVSEDNGLTWRTENKGLDLTYSYIWELREINGYLYACTSEGLYRSREMLTSVKSSSGMLSTFDLIQNYPNPFNPSTTIEYSILTPASGIPSREGKKGGVFVVLKVYDILGREVASLVDKQQKPGTYKVLFDASALTSGVYFYDLRYGDRSISKKMLLMK